MASKSYKKEKQIIKKMGGLICKICRRVLDYNYKYDAYYCNNCNEWREDKCSDEQCQECYNRPEKPFIK